MKEDRDLAPGTITRLVRQKKNPERVSVYLDGAFAFGIHQDVLLEAELRKGVSLSVDQQRGLLQSDEKLRARSRALDLLAYRSRSSVELSRRLRRDGFSDASIDAALHRLGELGMLDDRSFAEEFAASRIANKGYGPHRIAAELRARGIQSEIIEQVVDRQFEDDTLELEQARQFVARRLPRLERETDPVKRRRKLYDALMRRGYTSDVVRRVIDESLSA